MRSLRSCFPQWCLGSKTNLKLLFVVSPSVLMSVIRMISIEKWPPTQNGFGLFLGCFVSYVLVSGPELLLGLQTVTPYFQKKKLFRWRCKVSCWQQMALKITKLSFKSNIIRFWKKCLKEEGPLKKMSCWQHAANRTTATVFFVFNVKPLMIYSGLLIRNKLEVVICFVFSEASRDTFWLVP